MYPQSQNLGNDGESLQTDVMRFMAIIGFCLIAILALVRNVEPSEAAAAPAAEQAAVRTEAPQPPPPEPAPWKTVAQATPEPVSPPVIEPPEPVEPAPQQLQPPVIAKSVPEPEIEQASPKALDPEPQTTVAAETQPVEETAAEDESLVLRFASDGDFLRLIAKGDIQVYAFQETDVLTLSESYRFLDTQSPGQVYELLRPSIPGLIIDALKQARHDIDGFRWGIALPGRISNQIERHLGQVSGGQLVIDRYGEVHHVAAS